MTIECGQLLKSRAAAKILDCHVQTITALGRRGVLTPVRVGGMLRWRADQIAAIARGEVQATAGGVAVEFVSAGPAALTA